MNCKDLARVIDDYVAAARTKYRLSPEIARICAHRNFEIITYMYRGALIEIEFEPIRFGRDIQGTSD